MSDPEKLEAIKSTRTNPAYVGGFDDQEALLREFSIDSKELRGAKVYLAWYGFGSYDGEACVIFERRGKLYEVNGSHCSCNGLEGQWSPEETSWEALALAFRKGSKFASNYSSDEDKARARFKRLIDRRVPVEVQS